MHVGVHRVDGAHVAIARVADVLVRPLEPGRRAVGVVLVAQVAPMPSGAARRNGLGRIRYVHGVLGPVRIERHVGGGHLHLRARPVGHGAARRERPAVEHVAVARDPLAVARAVGQRHHRPGARRDRVGDGRGDRAAVAVERDRVVPARPLRREHQAACGDGERAQVGHAVHGSVA